MFFRFLMPPVVFVGALIYLFVHRQSGHGRRCDEARRRRRRRALVGYYLPDIFVSNRDRSAASNRSCAPFPTRST